MRFFYAPPYTIRSAGATGFQPPDRAGLGAAIVIMALAVLIPMVLICAAVLLG
ncbi:hypothetical protein [Nocardia rhizosphaerae]|uniref:Uncharacterized protein n=1 Tax=Nocardia rhizosphaerae TaxID=1691571 RepID=A0ABV8LAV1_9NOCA